jgi:hypothetical protein
MGFLDNSSITVDAILTKRGRQILAAGGDLNITKFALSDEEVDYTLWDVTHPNGTDSYGTVIENMSLLEATPARTSFRSYLIDNSIVGATINVAEPSGQLDSYTPVSLHPNTIGGISEQYTFTIENTNLISFDGTTAAVSTRTGTGFDLTTRPINAAATTTVTITGTISGIVKVVTISVKEDPGAVNPPDAPLTPDEIQDLMDAGAAGVGG